MTRKLSERQAWLLLAKKWATETVPWPFSNGAVYVSYGNGNDEFGLCHSIRQLLRTAAIDEQTEESMVRKIYIGWSGDCYRWPCTAAGAKKRVAFCQRQAEKLKRKAVKK